MKKWCKRPHGKIKPEEGVFRKRWQSRYIAVVLPWCTISVPTRYSTLGLRTVKDTRIARVEAATNSSEVRRFVTNWILRSWQPHRVTSGCFERETDRHRQTRRERGRDLKSRLKGLRLKKNTTHRIFIFRDRLEETGFFLKIFCF